MKKLFIGLFAVILLSAVLSAMYLFSTVEKPETILVNGTNTNPVSYTDSNFLAKLKSAYPTVYRILDNDEIKAGYVIPGLEQSQAIYHTGQNKGKLGISKEMDPQGMAIIDDKYIAISAYSRGKIFNSVIWLIDKVSGHYIKTIALDAAYHVGGITYDEDKHQLWIATVDDEGSHFIFSKAQPMCPLLNEKGLCKVVLELGEEGLCDTCHMHPRFYKYI